MEEPMNKISHLITRIAYILGVLAIVMSVAYASIPRIPNPLHVTTRGCLVFAITLFLCAIASHLIAQEKR